MNTNQPYEVVIIEAADLRTFENKCNELADEGFRPLFNFIFQDMHGEKKYMQQWYKIN